MLFAQSDRIAYGNRDIKTYGFSDILFAQTAEGNITWTKFKYHCEAISLAFGE